MSEERGEPPESGRTLDALPDGEPPASLSDAEAEASASAPEPLPPVRRLHPAFRLIGFLALLMSGAIVIQLILIATGLLSRESREGLEEPIPLLVTGAILVLLATGVTWLCLRWFEGRGLRTVGLGLGRKVLQRVAVGLVFGGLTPAIVALALAAVGMAAIARATPDLLAVTLPMFVATALLSAWEELVLRGYFMQAIAAMGGAWVASIVSGVLFGLMHAGNPGVNTAGLAITAVNGVLLALLAARTGSLWLVCGYHAGWNLVAAMLFGMRDSGMLAPGSLLSTDLHGPTLWTGGSYGFEASLLAFLVEAVILVVLLVYGPRWAGDPEAWPYYQRKR